MCAQPSIARVGVSRDFLDDRGQNVWGDIGLSALTEAGISWEYLPQTVSTLSPSDIEGYDALIIAAPAVTAATFEGLAQPPQLIARFGVGYDAIDLTACTAAGTILTITPDGARRPVSTATLTMILAVLHNLVVKDAIVREGDWSRREQWMGRGLTGRTVGLLGLGNVAQDLVGLLAPFDCRIVAHDPYASPAVADRLGVELLDLIDLARRSDVLVVLSALTEQTRGMVNDQILQALPEGAIVVNLSRGPIIDESALIRALESGRLGGAGLDVFEQEPTRSTLRERDDVVLSPHSLAWTDEMSAGNGASCVRAVLDVAAGRRPRFVVNTEVLRQPRWASLKEDA
ncbi:dehydrogenase [Calidifontibacter sp. DB0510]|uniref:Dehydrogenase n=1 Tax=Metallococcus carri TaxID=1656884 RepID=A0A967EFS2_9MICO|nr:NAD(P)-dependent oxidoreductase [Metallococcus carri]NHN54243.1 dehydrogenase [Metallococcus carri]NOP36917.1 dehydrogenase [Calidifontibacter sp. DB2511S]